jgi:hypothetical protein
MKNFIPTYHRPTILTGIALLCGLLLTLPCSDASAVGNWSYPKSDAERVERENILENQLVEQEKNYRSQHEVVTIKKSVMTDLKERIKLAKIALKFKKQPLVEAIEKYRQVQSLSLLDPMVSTEPQRIELIEAKLETAAQVEEHKKILQELEEKLPHAKAQIKIAIEHHKFILREIDSLMRHRDAVRELVFVRTVAD